MIFSVLRTSWTALSRDRSALALSFVVPIVFFSIFAVIFGGQRDAATQRVRLLAVDEDGSVRSRQLMDALRADPALDLRTSPDASRGAEPAAPYDRAAAERAVRNGDASVALVVPRGFGEGRVAFRPAAGAGAPLRVELLADSSDPIAPQIVQGLLQKAIFTSLGDIFLEGGITELDRVAGLDAAQRQKLDALLSAVRARPGAARTAAPGAALPLAIEVHDLLGESKRNPMIAFYAAGVGVMFLLFTSAGAGGSLIEERESGTLDRLLSTRLTMTQLLAGKLAYLVSVGVAQLVVMFVWGWLVFGLELPSHLAGFVLMAVPTALACSAFGLVLAAICRTRKQLVALSNLVILSISAVGGSMFPRFLMPAALQKASLVVFNSWALDGFIKVFWREEPLVALWPQIAVLLVWTAGLAVIARRVARKWEIA